MIGISLLTLVPGLSGGSETYVRELCRTLAGVGELRYRVFVPEIAPDASDGLPSSVVARYRASRTMPGRIAAMSLAALHPGPIRRASSSSDSTPFISRSASCCLRSTVRRPSQPSSTSSTRSTRVLRPRRARLSQMSSTDGRSDVRGWSSRLRACPQDAGRALRAVAGARASNPLGIDSHLHAKRQSVTRRLLLYPARPWRHKNHARLYEAFAHLRAARPELRLVLTGKGEFGALPEGVESRGLVSRGELVELYGRAAALVFPSLYEGFGMPIVEAMACGCPVACSNTTSLPEVVGNAARLFEPRDADDIAAAADEVLDDPSPGSRVGSSGRVATPGRPAPGPTTTSTGRSPPVDARGESLELRVDEQRDELLEGHFRRPAQPHARPRGIAHEAVQLCLAALQRFVDLNVGMPVEPDVIEGRPTSSSTLCSSPVAIT